MVIYGSLCPGGASEDATGSRAGGMMVYRYGQVSGARGCLTVANAGASSLPVALHRHGLHLGHAGQEHFGVGRVHDGAPLNGRQGKAQNSWLYRPQRTNQRGCFRPIFAAIPRRLWSCSARRCR